MSVSKASLERMQENGVSRATWMLRIHEPRRILQIMARIGQAVGVITLSLSIFDFLTVFGTMPLIARVISGIGALFVVIVSGLAQRLRFEEEGEEARIPVFTLLYIPIYCLLCIPARLVELLARTDSSNEDFKEAREAELRNIVDAEQETGVIEETERDMIQSVFGFHDRVVREVMIPRVDITAIEISSSLSDLLHIIENKGHSRVPVFEESLDNIRGIVYAKDLLKLLIHRNDLNLDVAIADCIRKKPDNLDAEPFTHEPYYIPETKKIDELLRDLRTAKTRLAIIVDEYGGTAGLVTTEDLVEEIFGELQDEYDAEEALFEWEDDGILAVNPRINIEELNDLLESDLPSDGFDTLGGFIYDHLGEVPDAGQILQIPGIEMEILNIEGQRISKVKITRVPLAEIPDEQESIKQEGG
tara:strand:- start:2 stop:1252 length:1251 start_codon:yes stop_codon:yes gene_type:complete